MRRKNILLLAAALAAAGLSLKSQRGSGAQDSASTLAPAFKLPDTNGRLVSLSDLKGQVVLLNFWATWCDTCAEEAPILKAVYRRHQGRGFSLLAVSVDENGKGAVLPYLAKHPVDFPVLLTDVATQQAYKIFGLPANFLIDAGGRIARVYQGPVDEKTLENDILELQAIQNPRRS